MKKSLYTQAQRLQPLLLRYHQQAADPAGWIEGVPRVVLDGWATLSAWHRHGERVWRISAAAADETADMLLPPDLDLATARVRGEAVAYQLPERSEWIVLARHAPAPCAVTVLGPDIGWSYAQPVLTYCTEGEDGGLRAGYYSLADYPTACSLPDLIRPGTATGMRGTRQLGAADTADESARVALALIHHYLP
ncbi:MAG TPA: hypothetical protein VHN79_07800 [Lacunisphaera sp.]|nr:hypothetical protein [Lacunisphaera sp.]